MRKYLLIAVAVIVSSLAITSVARADDIQSITAKLKPTSLPKKNFRPAQIRVEILTGPNSTDPTNPEQPPSAFNTRVNFPANMKFDTRKVRRCAGSEARLQNTTTKQAIRVCKRKSIVSKGTRVPTGPESEVGTSAWVTVDLPGPGTTLGVPVVVTAFNGSNRNSIFLHSRADSVNNTSVLVGRIQKGPKGFGRTLNVKIPPLLAGAITRFTVTVQNGRYVQARCRQTKMTFQAISRYDNHPTTTDDFTQRCKRR